MSEFRNRKLARALLASSLALLSAEHASAQAVSGALTSQAAVETAIQNNPSLHVALLQEAQAGYGVSAEEALFDPIFDASADFTHNRTPSIRDSGPFVSTTNSYDLETGLTKTFAAGTVTNLTLTGDRTTRSAPVVNAQGVTAFTGPIYSLGGKLTVTQPLLRGYGSTLGLASLRVARLNRTAAVLARQQEASQLLHDVLKNYWELWYTAEAVRIDLASRDLAQTLQTQADEQVKSGTLAHIDALTFATQLATLDEQVVSDTTQQRQQALALGQSMGRADRVGPDLQASDTPPDVDTLGPDDQAITEAFAASYQLKQLDAQLRIARDQASIAGDSLRPRLDLEGDVGSQGIGNREVPPAVDQFGRMEAVSAHVGLTFQTAITDARRSATVESALLNAHIAEKQIEVARQQLQNDVRSALARRNAAKRSLELSLLTEKVAGEQAEGEKGRFLAGTSIAITVSQADDAHRKAQLRVQRARVDLVEGELDLMHLRGKLLERYADALKKFTPSTTALEGAHSPM